ncbi:hypothetical protein H696_02334 [Fonticula alba]|uniref:Uncharacterized protein n=1 Tax=Fonticula alba TaxID=691883 RepID=A0A058ZBT4_FONAL|nr:hypothetical protein H696_02334 [Fonticula alba]KCV71383.1 hypothetical protein H696_02334 [Fonticula alba]|eukprot:XP_009494506.1 hypothetical protein H696_02334 [Fonticula alba]
MPEALHAEPPAEGSLFGPEYAEHSSELGRPTSALGPGAHTLFGGLRFIMGRIHATVWPASG